LDIVELLSVQDFIYLRFSLFNQNAYWQGEMPSYIPSSKMFQNPDSKIRNRPRRVMFTSFDWTRGGYCTRWLINRPIHFCLGQTIRRVIRRSHTTLFWTIIPGSAHLRKYKGGCHSAVTPSGGEHGKAYIVGVAPLVRALAVTVYRGQLDRVRAPAHAGKGTASGWRGNTRIYHQCRASSSCQG
jgi:hypothetical protein